MLLLLTNAMPAVANIGTITELKGNSEVVRKAKKLVGQPRLPIEQLDNIQTGNGRVKITFVDASTVSVTEHSKLVIDDFVYDGNPKTSKMVLKFASGTARFATGQKGLINKANINLKTPTATIAVRGTDFTTTVDDFGKSLIILLPEADGTVGEITVSNGAGSVILNRAFQATIVSTLDSRPSKPVILNMSLDMIDSMLIVSQPTVVTEILDIDIRDNILDLSELDIDFLKVTEVSALDVNAIDSNHLEDVLSDSMASPESTKDNVRITGTLFGYDNQTQIYAFIEQDKLKLVRSVSSIIDISINKDSGKNIIIDSNGKMFNIIVNDGGSNIIVKQSN